MQVLTTAPSLPTGAHPLENRGAVQRGVRAAARRLHARAHHGALLSPQVRAAARLLGDALLAKKLDELLAAIRRDLVAAPSL